MKIITKYIIFITLILTQQKLYPKKLLSNYKHNVYSQFGEDGVINEIFKTIGVKSKICIEFGAWDGFYLSNTANLWAHNNWKGILIESDYVKYLHLKEKIKKYNCIPINAFVGIDEDNCLENILKANNITDSEIDLLSIDIDGNDYYIFENLKLKPRLIICEYNLTMPPHLDLHPKYGNYIGCSVAALVRVAETKGYKLITIIGANCFFVLNDEFEKFTEFETSFDELIKIDLLTRCQKHLITSYDGKYLIVKVQNGIEPFGLNGRCLEPLYGPFAFHHCDIE